MLVKDYMTSDVVNVDIPGNRDDVLKILKRTGISGVPVLKNKKLVGIITRKDLLRKPEETQLGLLMTSKPITIGPDTDIRDAARLLVTHRIRRLPVVEDNKLAGLLSVADLIHAIAQMKIKEEIKDILYEHDLRTLGGYPAPARGAGHGNLGSGCDPDPELPTACCRASSRSAISSGIQASRIRWV